MGDYIDGQEQNFEERKDPTVKEVTREVPFKYWFAIAVLGIMVYVLYRQEKANIWHLVIFAIVLFFIFKSATENLDLKKQHTQGEAIMIVHVEIKKQIQDKAIEFPKGTLVMTGIAQPVVIEKEGKTHCNEIRVPFNIIESTGVQHKYLAIVDPYDTWGLGVHKILKDYK